MPTLSALPDVSELPLQPHFPDPLLLGDRSRVHTREDWFTRRRPELQRLFEHYMYGYAPPAPALEFRIEAELASVLGGKAALKLVTIEFSDPDGVPPIELLLVVPQPAQGPAPVFLGINFAGNHTLLSDVAIPEARCHQLEVHARAARGSAAAAWNIEHIIDRGYAFASFHTCDIKPDRSRDGEGIQRYFAWGAPQPNTWGTLRAWAWACSRAVDYLQTDADVDARRIAVVGHSRLGKAALLAGAFDERIALTIAHQSGCGGAAPSRSSVGESVRQINQSYPHWFSDEFKRFAAEPARLPFDQHCLVALIAPRPLLCSNAADDEWANPRGQFEVLRAAEPVYRLIDDSGLENERLPAVGELSAGRLGYFLRTGKHSMTTEDWSAFLRFADRHLR